jgi:DNA-binding CsgD family transcriptional regulator
MLWTLDPILWRPDHQSGHVHLAQPLADARRRGVVAVDAEAGLWYERSLAHQRQSNRPFSEALTHLLYGEHLRRTRQRSAARPQLRMAIEIFERLDAVPWVARARTQLRATGETVRRREDSPARSTPQELQVAQLVATGASTKSVAAQLYLSPRTVDSHLRQIFTKLGIASRRATGYRLDRLTLQPALPFDHGVPQSGDAGFNRYAHHLADPDKTRSAGKLWSNGTGQAPNHNKKEDQNVHPDHHTNRPHRALCRLDRRHHPRRRTRTRRHPRRTAVRLRVTRPGRDRR